MSSDGSPQPSSSSPVPAHRRRPRTPPKWVWIVLLLIGVLVAIVRGADVFGDHAFDNVATVILCFVGFVVLAVWFLFLSGYHWLSRLLVAGGCVAVAAALAVLFRIERLNGELVPVFAYRFSAKPDRLLEVPPAITEGKGQTPISARRRRTIFPDFSDRTATRRSMGSSWLATGRNGLLRWFGDRRSGPAGRPSPWSTATR